MLVRTAPVFRRTAIDAAAALPKKRRVPPPPLRRIQMPGTKIRINGEPPASVGGRSVRRRGICRRRNIRTPPKVRSRSRTRAAAAGQRRKRAARPVPKRRPRTKSGAGPAGPQKNGSGKKSSARPAVRKNVRRLTTGEEGNRRSRPHVSPKRRAARQERLFSDSRTDGIAAFPAASTKRRPFSGQSSRGIRRNTERPIRHTEMPKVKRRSEKEKPEIRLRAFRRLSDNVHTNTHRKERRGESREFSCPDIRRSMKYGHKSHRHKEIRTNCFRLQPSARNRALAAAPAQKRQRGKCGTNDKRPM